MWLSSTSRRGWDVSRSFWSLRTPPIQHELASARCPRQRRFRSVVCARPWRECHWLVREVNSRATHVPDVVILVLADHRVLFAEGLGMLLEGVSVLRLILAARSAQEHDPRS